MFGSVENWLGSVRFGKPVRNKPTNRTKVWSTTSYLHCIFQNVGLIKEFFGATEGTMGLVNLHGKVGAIGYLPKFPNYAMMELFKVDDDGWFSLL
jgi:hypothetical protein